MAAQRCVMNPGELGGWRPCKHTAATWCGCKAAAPSWERRTERTTSRYGQVSRSGSATYGKRLPRGGFQHPLSLLSVQEAGAASPQRRRSAQIRQPRSRIDMHDRLSHVTDSRHPACHQTISELHVLISASIPTDPHSPDSRVSEGHQQV